jgi:hypothetical protein
VNISVIPQYNSCSPTSGLHCYECSSDVFTPGYPLGWGLLAFPLLVLPGYGGHLVKALGHGWWLDGGGPGRSCGVAALPMVRAALGGRTANALRSSSCGDGAAASVCGSSGARMEAGLLCTLSGSGCALVSMLPPSPSLVGHYKLVTRKSAFSLPCVDDSECQVAPPGLQQCLLSGTLFTTWCCDWGYGPGDAVG